MDQDHIPEILNRDESLCVKNQHIKYSVLEISANQNRKAKKETEQFEQRYLAICYAKLTCTLIRRFGTKVAAFSGMISFILIG
jgi:hypothetical protein